MHTGNPTMHTTSVRLDDLHSVEQLAEAYPHLLSVPALRWQLRHRANNGLASACVRVGKRLMIDKTRYEAWLTERGERAASQ